MQQQPQLRSNFSNLRLPVPTYDDSSSLLPPTGLNVAAPFGIISNPSLSIDSTTRRVNEKIVVNKIGAEKLNQVLSMWQKYFASQKWSNVMMQTREFLLKKVFCGQSLSMDGNNQNQQQYTSNNHVFVAYMHKQPQTQQKNAQFGMKNINPTLTTTTAITPAAAAVNTKTNNNQTNNVNSELIPIGFIHVSGSLMACGLEENFIIQDLFVDESHRNLGVATYLIQYVLQWANGGVPINKIKKRTNNNNNDNTNNADAIPNNINATNSNINNNDMFLMPKNNNNAYHVEISSKLNNFITQHIYRRLGFIEYCRYDDLIKYQYKYRRALRRQYPTYYHQQHQIEGNQSPKHNVSNNKNVFTNNTSLNTTNVANNTAPIITGVATNPIISPGGDNDANNIVVPLLLSPEQKRINEIHLLRSQSVHSEKHTRVGGGFRGVNNTNVNNVGTTFTQHNTTPKKNIPNQPINALNPKIKDQHQHPHSAILNPTHPMLEAPSPLLKATTPNINTNTNFLPYQPLQQHFSSQEYRTTTTTTNNNNTRTRSNTSQLNYTSQHNRDFDTRSSTILRHYRSNNYNRNHIANSSNYENTTKKKTTNDDDYDTKSSTIATMTPHNEKLRSSKTNQGPTTAHMPASNPNNITLATGYANNSTKHPTNTPEANTNSANASNISPDKTDANIINTDNTQIDNVTKVNASKSGTIIIINTDTCSKKSLNDINNENSSRKTTTKTNGKNISNNDNNNITTNLVSAHNENVTSLQPHNFYHDKRAAQNPISPRNGSVSSTKSSFSTGKSPHKKKVTIMSDDYTTYNHPDQDSSKYDYNNNSSHDDNNNNKNNSGQLNQKSESKRTEMSNCDNGASVTPKGDSSQPFSFFNTSSTSTPRGNNISSNFTTNHQNNTCETGEFQYQSIQLPSNKMANGGNNASLIDLYCKNDNDTNNNKNNTTTTHHKISLHLNNDDNLEAYTPSADSINVDHDQKSEHDSDQVSLGITCTTAPDDCEDLLLQSTPMGSIVSGEGF